MEKITVDTAKGFDVMRGKTVVKNFTTKEEAKNFIGDRLGYYIRYWMDIEEEQRAAALFFCASVSLC